MTINELIQKLEAQKLDAERRQSDAVDAIKRVLARPEAEGRKIATLEEETRLERLTAEKRSAADAVTKLGGQLETARQVKAEEDERVRGERDAIVVTEAGRRWRGSHDTDADGERPFIRLGDGRPAAVRRGEPFAGHEVVSAYAAQRATADQAVVGQHGSFGNMLRAMTTTSGSAVVPTVWSGDIIDRVRNLSAVISAGAQTVPMDAKVVQIGRLTTDPTAAFRTEGSTVTASDPVFDNVTLTATTMSALVVGSLEWFMDAPNVDEVVSNAIAQAVATQLDLVSLLGQVTTGAEQTGTGNNMLPSGGLPSPNPRGVLATLLAVASSSVLGAGANGTSQTAATFWGEVIDTIFTPRDYNEAPNALLWPSHLARIYARAADTTNQPLRQPPDVEAMQKFVTNQIPSGFTIGTGTLMSDLFAGDWTQLIIGQRLDFTVQTLVERYAELGQVGIVAHWRGDVQLARPRAFAVYRYLKGV